MSGQYLSPSETGHALTPANHLWLGRLLPHQLPNSKQTAPRAINLWSGDIIRYYSRFRMAIPNPWARIYSLLSLSPLSILKINRSIFLKLLARLACLIHAANVHSEPGSNPSIICLLYDSSGKNPKAYRRLTMLVTTAEATEPIDKVRVTLLQVTDQFSLTGPSSWNKCYSAWFT